MINADKIRSMSNEELAEFIRNNNNCTCCTFFASRDCNTKSCKEGIIKWLESGRDEDD